MDGCAQHSRLGSGSHVSSKIATTSTRTTRTTQTIATLKDTGEKTVSSFDFVGERRQDHNNEHAQYHSGFPTRQVADLGSVQSAPDRFQYRQSSQSDHSSVHHGHHTHRFSNRSSIGIHRFESANSRSS